MAETGALARAIALVQDEHTIAYTRLHGVDGDHFAALIELDHEELTVLVERMLHGGSDVADDPTELHDEPSTLRSIPVVL